MRLYNLKKRRRRFKLGKYGKKKKKSKGFNPTVQLNLPPQGEPVPKGGNKKKNRQRQSQGQGGGNKGRGSGRGAAYAGGNQDNSYGRLLAGGDRGYAVYGKGRISGHSYYGDERDYYYPDYAAYGNDGRGGRDRRNNRDPYGMSDMEAALSYYNYDNAPRSKGVKQYQMF